MLFKCMQFKVDTLKVTVPYLTRRMINNNRHMDIYLVCKREIHLLGFIDYFSYVCN